MLGGNAVQPGNEFVHARIVFHGAGPQGVHPEIDCVVPGRKPGEVTQGFYLADLGKSRDAFTAVIRAERLRGVSRGNIERRQIEGALARRGLFEDQPLVLADVTRSLRDFVAHRGFCSISCAPASGPMRRQNARFRFASWFP